MALFHASHEMSKHLRRSLDKDQRDERWRKSRRRVGIGIHLCGCAMLCARCKAVDLLFLEIIMLARTRAPIPVQAAPPERVAARSSWWAASARLECCRSRSPPSFRRLRVTGARRGFAARAGSLRTRFKIGGHGVRLARSGGVVLEQEVATRARDLLRRPVAGAAAVHEHLRGRLAGIEVRLRRGGSGCAGRERKRRHDRDGRGAERWSGALNSPPPSPSFSLCLWRHKYTAGVK